MNIKRVLITLLLIHILALILTACGGKKDRGANNGCPVNYVRDQFGTCVPGGPMFGNAMSFPFYANASITDKKQFKKLMMSEFNTYSKCSDAGSAECRSLQVLVQKAGDRSYNVVLRGLAVAPGWNWYWSNSYFNNNLQESASSTQTFHTIAQAYSSNGKQIVRFQKSSFNAYNPFNHYDLEYTQNHLYLETDGLLSKDKLRFVLYYNGGKSGDNAIPVATGTLVKGRDYL